MRSLAARNGRSTAITSNRGGTSVYNREARPASCTVSVKGRPSLQDLNYRDITPMNSWGSFVTAWSNQLSPPPISEQGQHWGCSAWDQIASSINIRIICIITPAADFSPAEAISNEEKDFRSLHNIRLAQNESILSEVSSYEYQLLLKGSWRK